MSPMAIIVSVFSGGFSKFSKKSDKGFPAILAKKKQAALKIKN